LEEDECLSRPQEAQLPLTTVRALGGAV
jgi:hypothetical protein